MQGLRWGWAKTSSGTYEVGFFGQRSWEGIEGLEHLDQVPPITIIRPLCEALLVDVVDLLFGEPTSTPGNLD